MVLTSTSVCFMAKSGFVSACATCGAAPNSGARPIHAERIGRNQRIDRVQSLGHWRSTGIDTRIRANIQRERSRMRDVRMLCISTQAGNRSTKTLTKKSSIAIRAQSQPTRKPLYFEKLLFEGGCSGRPQRPVKVVKQRPGAI